MPSNKLNRGPALGLTTALIASLAACAKSPDAIVPVSMGDAYASMSCANAQDALYREQSTLASLSAAQSNAVAGDAVGVLLIGVPVSSLSGSDKEGLIAASKGKIIAMETRLRSC